MIPEKFVDLYALGSKIQDTLVAEREVVLTYVLKILSEHGVLKKLAFKGGTCIRKHLLGSTGRFSEDLDFSARTELDPDAFLLELLEIFNRAYYDIRFHFGDRFYITDDKQSCGAVITYTHSWNEHGQFSLQLSLREQPILKVEARPMIEASYFKHLELVPPPIPTLDPLEIIAEKIRACVQRTTARDIFDLYLFSATPFNREWVRTMTVIKLWNVKVPFDPERFFADLKSTRVNWDDLRRLVRSDRPIRPEDILSRCLTSLAFLSQMTPEEISLSVDARAHHLTKLKDRLIEELRGQVEA